MLDILYSFLLSDTKARWTDTAFHILFKLFVITRSPDIQVKGIVVIRLTIVCTTIRTIVFILD